MSARRRSHSCVLALALAVLLATPGLTAAQGGVPGLPPGPGLIRGVVEGPEGPAAGVQIALYALTAQGHPGLGDTTSDANGRFVFENVSSDPSIAYLLGARYAEIPFSRRVAFSAGQTEVDVQIAVSKPIADLQPVQVRATRIRIDWAGSQLAVRVTQLLNNPSEDIRFVPAGERRGAQPLRVASLPSGATGFTRLPAGTGEELQLVGADVAFWGPFFPGEQDLHYQYLLPASPGDLQLEPGFPNGSGSLAVAYPPTGPSVTASTLSQGEPIEIDGVRYESLEGGALEPGAKLALSLSLPEMRQQQAGALELKRSDLFLELDDASLIVNQDLTLEVAPGAPLVAAPGETLMTLELPVGAQLLGMSREAAALGIGASGSTVAIAGPLPPGTTRFGFRYAMAVESESVKLDLRFPLLLSTLRINIADTGDLVVSSSRLHRLRPARSGTRTYLQREAFHVEPGERIDLEIARPIQAPLPRTAAIALLVVAGALSCFYMIRPLQRDSGPDPEEEALDRISHERSLVYASIHDLDHDFETGKISEADYHGMRAGLRENAIELLRRERQPDAPVQEIRPAEEAGTAGAAVPTGAFCPACGGAVDGSWRFCSHCGGGLTPQQSTGSGSTG